MKPFSFVIVLLILSVHLSLADDSQWGSYPNRPLLLQDLVPPDGRNFSLANEFNYVDQNRQTWTAPKNLITDGASIPMPFWSVIGGPFEGLYREAAIVHDAGSCAQMVPWQDVHHMFYNAMRCSGVPWGKAKIMFFAVWARGPRWTTLNSSMPAECKVHPPIDPSLQAKLIKTIQTRSLSLAETKAVARPFFNARAMSDSDAIKFVADLKQRALNPKEGYAVAFSVVQSADFSDDAVTKTESWIEKENPSLEAIEARAEMTRKKQTGQNNGQGAHSPQVTNAAPFFIDIPEIRAQPAFGSQ